MSLGPIMIGISDTALTVEEREYLQHPAVGGVILFTRNYADPEQLQSLVAEIHGARTPHLLASTVFGRLAPRELVAWVLEDRLPVRVQLQMHKYVWAPETTGV